MFRRYVGPLLIAVAAAVATLATIAPDGNGPGVTCDELYHVYEGKQLVTALRQQGVDFFKPVNIDRNFPRQPGGLPVQSPLGHLILGGTHYLFDPSPDDPTVLSITAARFAPAMAFALIILIVGAWVTQREGWLAGTVAAAAVALMPRLFGHSHLAALDMLTTLFFVAAVLAVAQAARGDRVWQYALAGIVWGMAMLVSLHGLLVALPVIVWLVWRLHRRWRGGFVITPEATEEMSPQKWAWYLRWRFMPSLAAWLVGGGLTLLAGWPWFWLAPFTRLYQYVASGSDRQLVHVFYAGQVWFDRTVPWHYPWVIFAVTIPLGLLVLGLVGLWAVLRAGPLAPIHLPHDQRCPLNALWQEEGPLVLGTILFMLFVFSCPGTPVYDGERLFLMVFPLWAIWVGIGAQWLSCRIGCKSTHVAITEEWNDPRSLTQLPSERVVLRRHAASSRGIPATSGKTLIPRKFIPAVILAFVALQGIGLVIYHPCHLSYYSVLVGGLAGAERLGFETTYWGDTVREPMLAEAARLSPDKSVLFAPNLAPFQAAAVTVTSPALREAGVSLVGWDRLTPEEVKQCRYAVIYNRRADLAGEEWVLLQGRVVAEYGKQGVWLARLIDLAAPLDAPAWPTKIDGLP